MKLSKEKTREIVRKLNEVIIELQLHVNEESDLQDTIENLEQEAKFLDLRQIEEVEEQVKIDKIKSIKRVKNTDELLKEAQEADFQRASDLFDLFRSGTINREELNNGCKEIVAFHASTEEEIEDYER